MPHPLLVRVPLVCAVVLGTVGTAGAQFLVITRAAGGALRFEEAESVVVNGKDKIRGAASAVPLTGTWDSKSIGHLPDVRMETLIRNPPRAG